MSSSTPGESLDELLQLVPQGVDLDRFAKAWNLTAVELEALFIACPLKRVHRGTTSWGVAPPHWEALGRAVRCSVAGWHRDDPESLGPNDYELDRLLSVKVPEPVLREAIDEQIENRNLTRTGTIVHDLRHTPRANPSDLKLRDTIEPMISNGHMRPPLVRELAANLSMELVQLEEFLDRGTRLGWFTKVAENRYYTPSGVQALANLARCLAAESVDGEFMTGAYRDRAGIGRNLTIEVLEYFDKVGLTRRTESGRRINTSAGRVFASSSHA